MNEVTEKIEGKKEQNKEEFFEAKTKEVARKQLIAIIKGWAIVGLVALLEYLFIFSRGIIGIIAGIIFFFIAFFMVMYFVWGPEDVCWATFPREGYTKGILLGNQLSRFVGITGGKAYTSDWDVVDIDDTKALKKSRFIPVLGMYLFAWPFEKVYMEKTEWERYYPNLKKSLPRRELLREFTLLSYPFYVEIDDAEDMNRLGVTAKTNVVMRIVNPKKALFRQATAWPDIVRVLIKGGYVSYIKRTTLNDMLTKKDVEDIGADLLEKMPSPTNLQGKFLKDMVEEVYGIQIVSISVIDIIGADEEEQRAINAKAIAKLNRDATLINADANAQKSAIETIGSAIKMLAQMVAETDSSDDEAKQKESWARAENMLKEMIKKETEKFEKQYGKQFNICIDFVQRKMAIDKGRFADVRTPDAKGGTADLMSMLTVSDILAQRAGKQQTLPSNEGNDCPPF